MKKKTLIQISFRIGSSNQNSCRQQSMLVAFITVLIRYHSVQLFNSFIRIFLTYPSIFFSSVPILDSCYSFFCGSFEEITQNVFSKVRPSTPATGWTWHHPICSFLSPIWDEIAFSHSQVLLCISRHLVDRRISLQEAAGRNFSHWLDKRNLNYCCT